MIDYITPIKEQIDIILHNHCVIYKAISSETGCTKATLRYYNFGSFCYKTKKVSIKSTQFRIQEIDKHGDANSFRYGPIYYIDCSGIEEYENVSKYNLREEFHNQFRKYRTEFLKQHYPTINAGY